MQTNLRKLQKVMSEPGRSVHPRRIFASVRMRGVTPRERRIERLWAALAEEKLDALVVAGKGLIGQYGMLEWCAG